MTEPTVALDASAAAFVAECVRYRTGAEAALGRSPTPAVGRLVEQLSAIGHNSSGTAESEQHWDSYTTTEAAAALGVSDRTIRRRAVELGGRKIGHAWVFDPTIVERH